MSEYVIHHTITTHYAADDSGDAERKARLLDLEIPGAALLGTVLDLAVLGLTQDTWEIARRVIDGPLSSLQAAQP